MELEADIHYKRHKNRCRHVTPKHSALLGLDILKKYNFIVDLDKLELYPSMRTVD